MSTVSQAAEIAACEAHRIAPPPEEVKGPSSGLGFLEIFETQTFECVLKTFDFRRIANENFSFGSKAL